MGVGHRADCLEAQVGESRRAVGRHLDRLGLILPPCASRATGCGSAWCQAAKWHWAPAETGGEGEGGATVPTSGRIVWDMYQQGRMKASKPYGSPTATERAGSIRWPDCMAYCFYIRVIILLRLRALTATLCAPAVGARGECAPPSAGGHGNGRAIYATCTCACLNGECRLRLPQWGVPLRPTFGVALRAQAPIKCIRSR